MSPVYTPHQMHGLGGDAQRPDRRALHRPEANPMLIVHRELLSAPGASEVGRVQGGSHAVQAGRHIAQQVPARQPIALFF